MRLDDQRRSSNIEDRRGMRGGGGGGGGGIGLLQLIGSRFGIGGLIVVGLLFLFAPAPIKNMLLGLVGGGSAPTQQQGKVGAPTDQTGDRLAAVVGSTEDVWSQQFAAGKFAHYGYNGREYPPTTLVAFERGVATGCGNAPSAVGPFYCPADKRVYIDPAFFGELRTRFQVAGDFAENYVIAHEVGHHIQTVIGISDQVMQVRRGGNERLSNAEQVKMELQADCFAGVWAKNAVDAQGRSRMEAGDLEEGLNAANAIGDDTLQRKARGTVQPESFTHGTSEQRKRWLRQGYETGDPAQCDTFAATDL
jgi:uncharacterized protein